MYRQLGHYYGQARTHFEIAWGAERQGHYGEALAHSRQALEAFRVAGDREGAAIALNTQGWCLTQLGSHQQALACSRQALAVLQETGHGGGEAAAWMTVGFASHPACRPPGPAKAGPRGRPQLNVLPACGQSRVWSRCITSCCNCRSETAEEAAAIDIVNT